MKNIISIMPVWDEQNMIALSLYSTKDFITEYIIILQKGIDKTKEVIDYCQKLWNLNITYINSDLKLRYKRELIMNHARSYADYYIIQDGDEIFDDNFKNELNFLIENNYTFATAPIVLLENDLNHTSDQKENIIMPNHPFFFKNVKDIYFPSLGDMPWYDPSKEYHKIKNYDYPLKFDCKIKNYRRKFLREMFTAWHDSESNLSIEKYCDIHHYNVKWYRNNINENLELNKIIELCEIEYNKNKFKWNIIYDEELYYKKPSIIQKFINMEKYLGINNMDDLKILNSLK